MLANTRMVSLMVKEDTLGLTVASIKVSSGEDLNMGQASGVDQRITQPMSMKDITSMTRSMVMVHSHGHQAILMSVTINKMRGMARVRCLGLMVQSILETGSAEFNMAKVKWCSLMGLKRVATLRTTYTEVKNHLPCG